MMTLKELRELLASIERQYIETQIKLHRLEGAIDTLTHLIEQEEQAREEEPRAPEEMSS